jgi:hypothetical protein
MALPSDLLSQARLLATKEPKRPKQASLRRAISNAYYALFHLLVDSSCRFVISGQSKERKMLREQLARSYDHGSMKNASKAFAGNGASPWVGAGGKPSAELIRVTEAFVVLQQQRHEADYNIARHFTRHETLAQIARAEAAFQAWNIAKQDPAADAFLLALLVKGRH